MSKDLGSRIDNLKFSEAANCLDGEPEYTCDIIEALARVVGDVGGGIVCSDMGIIINAACDAAERARLPRIVCSEEP